MKGIFYSAIAMMLIIPVVMYIILYMDTAQTNLEEISTKIKGDKMAGYSISIEQDLPRILDIAMKRSIGAAITYIDMNGEPLDSADERLIEMMKNGTINGTEFSMLGTGTIKQWAETVEAKGSLYGFQTNITFLEMNITPYDYFHVLLSAKLTVNITDGNGNMKVNRLYDEKILISVEGFEDPLYGLKTSGLVKRKFALANITINNVTKLDMAVSSKFYMNSSTGASFLDRLEGSLTVSDKYKNMAPNGIGMETIVYLPDLSAVGLTIKPSQSDIDYLYFNTTSIPGYAVENSTYSWLKLDNEHANKYGVKLL